MTKLFNMDTREPLPPPAPRPLSRADLAAVITAVGASALMIGAVVGYSAGVLATLAPKRRSGHAL
jgi:hypothetical protein